MRWKGLVCAITALLLAACGGGDGGAAPEPARVYPPNDPNAQFGSPESLLYWTSAQQQICYRNMELIYPTRTISRTAGSPNATYELPSTPSDYGMLAMRGGMLMNGVRVLPDDWMQQSTTPAPAATDYGFLWWLIGSGNFAASGLFGQTIQTYPQENLFIVMQSFWPSGARPEFSGYRTAISAALRAALQ